MQTYLKTKPVWMQMLLFLGMAFGLFLIATLIGVQVLSKITGIDIAQLQNSENLDLANPKMITFIRGMILLQFLFLFVVPSLLFAYFSDPEPARYLGLKMPTSALYWIFGVLIIAVAYPCVEYLAYMNQKIPVGESAERWMKGMEEEAARQIKFMLQERTPMELVKNLVFIALFAGVGEELLFRGILQRMFIRATQNPWAGIILTAAIFSGVHFQFYGFFPRLFLGILLGAIYWYSGSLWVSILAHFLYDAFVVVVVYSRPTILEDPNASLLGLSGIPLLLAALISLALTYVILQQMQKRSVTSYEAIYSDDFPKQKDDFSF
jgi:uncharacterized protein